VSRFEKMLEALHASWREVNHEPVQAASFLVAASTTIFPKRFRSTSKKRSRNSLRAACRERSRRDCSPRIWQCNFGGRRQPRSLAMAIHRDFSYGCSLWRAYLAQSLAFTAIAVLTLALGIAPTPQFSVL